MLQDISSQAQVLTQKTLVWGVLGLLSGQVAEEKSPWEAGVFMAIGTLVGSLADRAFYPYTTNRTQIAEGMYFANEPTAATTAASVVSLVVRLGITGGLAKCVGLKDSSIQRYIKLSIISTLFAGLVSIVTYGAAIPVFFPDLGRYD